MRKLVWWMAFQRWGGAIPLIFELPFAGLAFFNTSMFGDVSYEFFSLFDNKKKAITPSKKVDIEM